MTQYNDKLIPDVGKCFKISNQYKFTCSLNEDCEEVEIGEDIFEVIPNHYILGNKFEIVLSPNTKKDLINKLFTNDDQIAIMLNYQYYRNQKNNEIYNLMQDWRNWFSIIIIKIKDLK